MLKVDIVSLTIGLFIGICIGKIFSAEINLIIKTTKVGIAHYVKGFKKSIQDK